MTAATTGVETARLFQALSDPTRLQILGLLRGGERCVCELTGVLNAAQSRLSFHLKVLKDAGLVTDRRDGRWVYYTVRSAALSDLQGALEDLVPTFTATGSADSKCCG